LLAVPVGLALFEFLFDRIGARIRDDVFSDATTGSSGVESLLAAIFMPIAAVMVAVIVVVAMVAPVFAVLPIVGIVVALRSSRAGLIMRSVAFTLAAAFLLGGGVVLVASMADRPVEGRRYRILEVRTCWVLARRAYPATPRRFHLGRSVCL
jgi:hypothetical protein